MKINLIILASGNSKRFNGNKLLTKFKDRNLYLHTFDKIKNIQDKFNQVIVVTQYEEIYDTAISYGFTAILNNESHKGISNSIKLGISRDLTAKGYMFMVCDQPNISEETLRILIDKFVEVNKGICSVEYSDRLGNPNIFSRRYIDELLALDGDIGGKAVIKNHLNDLDIVYLKSEIELKDIDTREDLC